MLLIGLHLIFGYVADYVLSSLGNKNMRWGFVLLQSLYELYVLWLSFWVLSSVNFRSYWWVLITGLVLLAGYRLFNRARLILSPQEPDRLKRSFLRSSAVIHLTSALLVTAVIYILLAAWPVYVVVIGMSVLMAALTFYHRLIYRLPERTEHLSDKELPSVSLLVPARNETRELVECLESLVAIDYPKLEILVVDDCSTNTKTSQIIKSFARSGVRFIKGSPPSDSWIGKNNAYQALYEAASSEWLFFLGTDIRMGKHSLRNIMSIMGQTDLEMVSIMPFRDIRAQYGLLAPLRHWWEFVLPREILKRPPVLSTAWLVQKGQLKPFGGLRGVSRSVIPERHIAKHIGANYAFWLAEPRKTWLSTTKGTRDRYGTAYRHRYPQLKRRVERVAITSIAMVGFTVTLLGSIWFAPLIGLVAYALVGFSVFMPALTFYGLGGVLRSLLWPLLLLQEIAIINYSMYKYELSQVSWSGRNICLPVMRVIKQLPPID